MADSLASPGMELHHGNSMTIEMHQKLVHAVTVYDINQSTKRGYDRNALLLYLQAIDRVTNAVNCGSTRRDALVENFSGRLLEVCLKALNMEPSTREERM